MGGRLVAVDGSGPIQCELVRCDVPSKDLHLPEYIVRRLLRPMPNQNQILRRKAIELAAHRRVANTDLDILKPAFRQKIMQGLELIERVLVQVGHRT